MKISSRLKSIIPLVIVLIFCCWGSSQIKLINENLDNDKTLPCDLISDYKRAKEFTLSYLETMPEEHYNFQPTPEIISFKNEAIHLGLVNYRYAAMIAGSYDASDTEKLYNLPSIQSKEEVIKWVNKSYDIMINQIESEENLEENTYYYRWNCSKKCLARKGFEHQSHHRGKWAVYLRLVNVKPPGERLVWDWSKPKDISKEEWKATENYLKYNQIIDK